MAYWSPKMDGRSSRMAKKKCSTSQRWSLLRSKGAPFSKSANGQRTKPNPKPKWRRLTCEERGGRGVHGAEQDKQNERDTQYDDQAVRRRHRRRRVVERQQQTAGLFGQHLAVVVVVVFAGVTLATDHAHTHTHTHTQTRKASKANRNTTTPNKRSQRQSREVERAEGEEEVAVVVVVVAVVVVFFLVGVVFFGGLATVVLWCSTWNEVDGGQAQCAGEGDE